MKDLLFDLISGLKIIREWLQHNKLILNLKNKVAFHIQYKRKDKKDTNPTPNAINLNFDGIDISIIMLNFTVYSSTTD